MTPKSDIEELSAKLHEIYMIEAKRQGDVRHHDDYAMLKESTKEYDRVLARFILEREANLSKQLEEAEEKYVKCCGGRAYLDEKVMRLEKQLEVAEKMSASIADWIVNEYDDTLRNRMKHTLDAYQKSKEAK